MELRLRGLQWWWARLMTLCAHIKALRARKEDARGLCEFQSRIARATSTVRGATHTKGSSALPWNLIRSMNACSGMKVPWGGGDGGDAGCVCVCVCEGTVVVVVGGGDCGAPHLRILVASVGDRGSGGWSVRGGQQRGVVVVDLDAVLVLLVVGVEEE